MKSKTVNIFIKTGKDDISSYSIDCDDKIEKIEDLLYEIKKKIVYKLFMLSKKKNSLEKS